MAVQTIWDIDHECNHSQQHDLSHKKPHERAGFAQWLGTKNCTDCFRKQQNSHDDGLTKDEWIAERRRIEAQDALIWSENHELPDLEGTEKQVPYAVQVRMILLQDASDSLDGVDFEELILVPARRISAARWWLDQKDSDSDDLAELLESAVSDVHADIGSENPF